MTGTSRFRWLHLSDFHVGKNGYGEKELFEQLVDHVNGQCANGFVPSILLLTGDLAQAGKQSEYEAFRDKLLDPLLSTLEAYYGHGWTGRVFGVPGNHDVDRKADYATRDEILRQANHFLLPTAEGLEDRRPILDRFAGFREIAAAFSGTPADWLDAPSGFFADRIEHDSLTIGVAGINTAWLCKEDDEEGKLRAGPDIVKHALSALADADIKLVLGHHPITWLHADERKLIEKHFADHSVIYFHGHLHRPELDDRKFRGEGYLMVQGGAAFQAHDHPIWVNEICWGEIDFRTHQMRLQPRAWSPLNEWVLALQHFGADNIKENWACFDLPTEPAFSEETSSRAHALGEDQARFAGAQEADLRKSPKGWTWIDQNWLGQHRKTLSDEDLIRFFDGRIPDWQLALSERVPRRAVVAEAEGWLRSGAADPRKPTVVLLQGAGGEGKSTAFHQTIVQLLENNPDWHVLWRDNDVLPLPSDWIADLPDDGRPVLIATDEADNIGDSLLAFVEVLRRADHDRFHFLLAARDSDWRGSKQEDAKWRELANFQRLRLRGITEVDAEKIYNAWSGAGEQGLGRLGSMTRDNAIRRLVATSRDKEVDLAEGAFLGAMIELRFGERFKDYVRKLLDRLKDRPAPGGNLFDAYAYIAAMHAENLLFLSPPVLAGKLGCTREDMRRRIVVPLADEACGSAHGNFILTRHRAIAEAAIEIMEEEGEDRWTLITDLAEQAVRIGFAGVHVPHTASWRFKIADFLAERGDHAKASDLIETFLTIEPNDVFFLNKLAQLYRKSGDAEKAERLYRDSVERILADPSRNAALRAFFCEWSAAAGNAGVYALNIWLAGVSLSNWQDLPR